MATTPPMPPSLGISAHLPPSGLIAIAWCSVGLAGIFVLARTLIRTTKAQKLRFDDYWIYFAYLVLVSNTVFQTLQTPHLYYLEKGNAGLVPIDEVFLRYGNQYVRYEFTIMVLFWTVLWSVKASFLALYWQLFTGLAAYKKWWFGVAVFVFGAYVGCWIASALSCHPASSYFHFDQCQKPSDHTGAVISVTYSTTADVLTDLMIMSLPLNMLWNVRLAFKQKLGLAAVFSLGTVIMLVAVVRAAQITRTAFSDGVLLALWGIVESTVSVIVGCLPPFKSLFRSRAITSRRYTTATDYMALPTASKGVWSWQSDATKSDASARQSHLHRLSSGHSQIDTFSGTMERYEVVPKGNIAVLRKYEISRTDSGVVPSESFCHRTATDNRVSK